MRLLRAAAVRLRSLVRRRDADDDVDAELTTTSMPSCGTTSRATSNGVSRLA